MSDTIGSYSFLPWLRQGVANKITAADMDTSVQLRASIPVTLALEGNAVGGDATLSETIAKDIQLYGPGDIVGVDSKAIIKTDPLNWITNFEPNYLPYMDFYDEDFPWRYTPAAPDTAKHRLRPWLCLVVVTEEEFKEGRNIKDKPLPYVEVGDFSVFTPADQLWAWAHVHVNKSLAASDSEMISTDMNAVMGKFEPALNSNPDIAYSRIMCPRRLAPNTAYHGFLMPVFESGRLAGLGLPVDDAPHATFSAWADYTSGTRASPTLFPYYHRYYFRTGTIGDFEYLVRLLKPQPIDKRVGRRDMDVTRPGANLPAIDDAELGGVLKLGGALKIPFDTLKEEDKADVIKYDNWDQPYPHPFQTALAGFINLADDYSEKTAAQANTDAGLDSDPDPLITAPLYGRWHALTQRLLNASDDSDLSPNDNWVHELNLDPRYRVAAGFGTKVVQEKQEEYMNGAWAQIGDVLEANRRIRLAQLAKAVSMAWYDKHVLPLHNLRREKALAFTAPMQARILTQAPTSRSQNGAESVAYQFQNSVISASMVNTATRRVLKPRGRVLRALPFDGQIRTDNFLARLNQADIVVVPEKGTPPGALALEDAAQALMPDDAPDFVLDWLKDFPFLPNLMIVALVLLILLLLIIGAGVFGWGFGAVIAAGLVYLYRRISLWQRKVQQADSIRENNQTPASVDRLPKSPDFRLSEPDGGFTPAQGVEDSLEAVHFKTALKESYTLFDASRTAGHRAAKASMNLAQVSRDVVAAIDPAITIPRRAMARVLWPARIKAQLLETFVEAMAYPQFDTPMYKPLAEYDAELFLPNINYIEQNSISLLETNQKFIESYMVGLNHEFARELLWREYVTDQRGSYFRQFWDVSSFLDRDGLDDEALKEKLRDIPPLHRWSKFSELGDHDHREEGGAKEEEVVLVIRGELLKKYPTAVIYAHRAQWQTKEGGGIDNTKERRLVDLTAAEEANPPPEKVKTPLYEAKVDPDIYFFGFDLTAAVAKGGSGENPDDDPGWFFVIKERPGEPRFGLDISRDGDLNVWNDLAWEDLLPGGQPGDFLQITSGTPSFSLLKPVATEDQEKLPQWEDDKSVPLNKDTNAADLAYIFYQAPVLVAVHASEMLPKD